MTRKLGKGRASALLASASLALLQLACSDEGESEPSRPDNRNSDNGDRTLLGDANVTGSAGSTAVAATPATTPPDPAASAPVDESTSIEPLNPALASFRDPDSSFVTQDVHDSEREVVHFDVQRTAMVAASSGDSVSGWATDGNELRWRQSGAPFRVRFGTEDGERRAYFTEAGNGTICNLELDGPETLRIFATSQLPPQ